MLKSRIIPCLDVNDGRVVKGVKFQNNVELGDPVGARESYEEAIEFVNSHPKMDFSAALVPVTFLAQLHFKQGNYEEGRELLDEMYERGGAAVDRNMLLLFEAMARHAAGDYEATRITLARWPSRRIAKCWPAVPETSRSRFGINKPENPFARSKVIVTASTRSHSRQTEHFWLPALDRPLSLARSSSGISPQW